MESKGKKNAKVSECVVDLVMGLNYVHEARGQSLTLPFVP